MQLGTLDRYVTIQQATKAQDAAFQEIETWSTYAQVWARKMDIRPRDRFAADQVIEEEITTFRVHYMSALTVEMRVVHDSKTYEIIGIAELGRREGLDVTARAMLP